MPLLREEVSYKNTVASSVPEIKAFIEEVIEVAQIDPSLFIFDFSQLGDDNFWYLRQIQNASAREALLSVV